MLGLLLVAFQNCSPGFRVLEPSALPGTRNDASTDGEADDNGEGDGNGSASTIPEKMLSFDETEPVEVALSGEDFSPVALPEGALFDGRVLRWLPRVGQTGAYKIEFKNTLGEKSFVLNLQVSARSATALARGPSDGAADGDVGFVFIHGMGSVDRCGSSSDLTAYWSGAPATIVRETATRTVACYDARASAESQAPKVAQQILDADCGKFNRCILVTHSMGGLVTEFIMTHDRDAKTGEDAALFANAELFKKAKARTLAVISLASASGGSKVADALASSNSSSIASFVGGVARWIGSGTQSAASVTVARATTLVPIDADPGVPFYMVAGYSVKSAWEWDPWFGGLWSAVDDIPMTVFQGDQELMGLDSVIQPSTRWDGLVDFRSACGVRSADSRFGPGYSADASLSFNFCATAAHKPNHYPWLISNLNHYLIAMPWTGCGGANPCEIREYSPTSNSFSVSSAMAGMSAIHAIRYKLDRARPTLLQRSFKVGNGVVTEN